MTFGTRAHQPFLRQLAVRIAAVAGIWLGAGGAALATISGEAIRVGLLVDMKSIYAHISGPGSVAAAQMAIDDVGGMVAGRPIHLLVADTGNDVARSSAIARKWLDEQGVDVIADVVGSPIAMAVQEINRTRGAVVFYNGVMSSALTGSHCAPTGVHWMYDGYAFSSALGRSLTRAGTRRWFMLTVDNAFGHNVQTDLQRIIADSGGEVIGQLGHPLGERRLFPRLARATRSGAQAIALVNAGQDLIRTVRQSYDLLAISRRSMTLAAVATTLNDVHLMTPQLAQGLKLAHAFYWNFDAETRAWAFRFHDRTGVMPNDLQAGVYSALTHYFKAVAASRSDDGPTVVAKMRELPIRDPIVRNAYLRKDGRMVHDILLLEVKAPGEIDQPWDYLRVLQVIPGDEAFRPPADGGCPLLQRPD